MSGFVFVRYFLFFILFQITTRGIVMKTTNRCMSNLEFCFVLCLYMYFFCFPRKFGGHRVPLNTSFINQM